MSTMTDNFQGATSMALHLGRQAAKRNDNRLTEDDRADLCAEMNVESWSEIRPGHRKKLERTFKKGFNDVKRETDIEKGVADSADQGDRPEKHLSKTSGRRRPGSRKSDPRIELQRRSASS